MIVSQRIRIETPRCGLGAGCPIRCISNHPKLSTYMHGALSHTTKVSWTAIRRIGWRTPARRANSLLRPIILRDLQLVYIMDQGNENVLMPNHAGGRPSTSSSRCIPDSVLEIGAQRVPIVGAKYKTTITAADPGRNLSTFTHYLQK